MTYRPLADEIRPQTLDEVVGQRHILGEEGLLRRIIESGSIPNLVFYGPSGTGKTTVANIIARRTNRPLHRLNATTASISDIKDIIGQSAPCWPPTGCSSTWTRSSTSTRSSSSPCWSSWRTGRSPSSPPPPRTPISMCTTRCSAAPPCLSSSPSRPPTCAPPWSGASALWGSGWGPRRPVRTGWWSTSPPPAAATCARP